MRLRLRPQEQRVGLCEAVTIEQRLEAPFLFVGRHKAPSCAGIERASYANLEVSSS